MASSTIAAPTADLTNERVAYGRLLALGLQHVLVMYAGTVAVPLIVGGALHLPKEQLAFLINADLFAAGLATSSLKGVRLGIVGKRWSCQGSTCQ